MAAAAKLPLEAPVTPPVAILRQVQTNNELGTHNSEFEAANGIIYQESGSEGLAGGANRIGSFR